MIFVNFYFLLIDVWIVEEIYGAAGKSYLASFSEMLVSQPRLEGHADRG